MSDDPSDPAQDASDVRPARSADGEHAPGVRTGDFAFGQRFTVVCEPRIDRDRYLVEDARSRVVAVLPVRGAGEIETRAGRCAMGVERRRYGWEVVARGGDGTVLARAYPRWGPTGYRLWVAPDSSYRLRRRWTSNSWILAGGGNRLANIAIERGGFSRARREPGHRVEVASIEMLESPLVPPPLALLIPLALETIKANEAIIALTDAGPVPY